MSKRLGSKWVGGLAVLCGAPLASAAVIVDFKPLPASPVTPEFVFNGPVGSPSFQSGPGSIGNADGTLPIVNQTPGGLLVEAPFILPGIPGSQFTAVSTLFFDSTLLLNGLIASAPAINGGGTLIQPLGPGSFTLLSTDPDGAGPLQPTLLLSGNLTNTTFVVGTNNAGATFNALGVNYTGGAIFNALVAAGGLPNNNSMSISMDDVTPSFSIDPADGFLADFTADATGLFNATVPEPTTLMGFALLAPALLMRRKR